MNTSIWEKTVTLPSRLSLQEPLETEIVIIGAGLAGILTAWRLQERGKRPILLEAAQTASGQTRNTTAKITCQHGLIYEKLLAEQGQEKALAYAAANQAAIEEYRRIVREQEIQCDFADVPAYLYTTEGRETFAGEAAAAKKLGIDCQITRETTLPFPVTAALKFPHQAMFHPLKFCKALSQTLAIYENTPVERVSYPYVFTKYGTVKAEKIVIATHYPFVNFPGYYFTKMHQERSYVVGLEEAALLDGTYLSVDENGYSWRNSENVLLLGGCDHRTGENRPGGRYQELQQAARDFYPNSREVARWSAQDCMTPDGIPYIGPYAAATPQMYVATGFQKWGMTGSMVAAMVLEQLILGKESPWAEVFSPQRFQPVAAGAALLTEGLAAAKGLARSFLSPPRATLDELPLGHGGIVACGGEKVGVYKDLKGETFVVNIRCPHLGCQLEWNPDETSWDCPCHGSRFDYRGKLLDNPAQENL